MPSLHKPARWAITRGLTAPEWNWFWKRARSALIYWGDGQAEYDYAQKKIVAFINAPVRDTQIYGKGIDHVVDSTDRYVDLGNSARLCPGELGLFWYGSLLDHSGQDDSIIERDFTSAAEPFYSYRMVNAGNTGDLNTQFDIAGTRVQHAVEDAGIIYTQHNSIALSVKDGDQESWVNGISVATSSEAGTITDYGTPTRIGSSELFDTNEFNGKTACTYILEGGLSPSEVNQLHNDPFGPFRFADEVGVVYGVPAVGGVTLPIFDKHYRQMRAA